MKITYWSDFACPYCYIGNTRLKKAIDELGIQDEVEFDIHAFELDQNAPKDVESTTVERFALKYNLSIDDAQKEVDNISKLGIEDGIDFRYASTLYTNTRDAHRLMKLAQSKDDPKLAERLSTLLFDAYFSQNLKLADKKVLLDVSKDAGLDPKEAEDVLNTNLYDAEVERDEEIALSGGIHAVPFYLFDGKYSVPGALSFEDFKSVLSQILEENVVDNDKEADSCEDGVCRL
ncbi:MAG: DsbA family oxidoreductase [Methanobrevibacter sp.]|nr:DsbA family oxidoreductase [Methanobrevibacter sp.]